MLLLVLKGERMIYRIAEINDWHNAQQQGYFESSDLAADGFIHCCKRNQLSHVVSTYYQGREDVVLLEIDDTQLDVPLRWEDLIGIGEPFPHVYGKIPLVAIARQLDLQEMSRLL